MTKKKAKKTKSAYAAAGVDIEAMNKALQATKRMMQSTFTPGVAGDIGQFGGLFESPGKDQLLVSSTDGVGTKLKVAQMADRHDTVGQDLVNHCVNDVLVQGAKPLFFLDYLGTAGLAPDRFKDVVSGVCKACRENGCALLGGETAEMPGIYAKGEYDLVGTMVGSVHAKKVVTGETIRPGDVLIALPSAGLHTNGYSLARKLVFDELGLGINDPFPGAKKSVADTLLTIHRSYLKPVIELLDCVTVRGMAHITGGGLLDNLPRILPAGTAVEISRKSWKVPNVFNVLQEAGSIDDDEMHRVFNMGIGFIIIVRQQAAERACGQLKTHSIAPKIIGEIVDGNGTVTLS